MLRDGTSIEMAAMAAYLSANVSGYGTCVLPLCFVARTKLLIAAVIIHLSPEIQMQLSYRLPRHDAIMAKPFHPPPSPSRS